MNNKIKFLENSKRQSSNTQDNATHSGFSIDPNNTTSSSSGGPSSSSLKVDQTQLNSSTNTSNIPHSGNTNTTRVGPQRRPIQLEGYRQLCFEGIPGYLNVINQELRNKLPKFAGNNAITCEDHLRCFLDLVNDYEVQFKDVIMKLFVQSLSEDAREWFKRLPKRSIPSWRDLEYYFKEQYGEKPNPHYILNEFNNIKKLPNESIPKFNVRFQKGMHRLSLVMNLEDSMCLTTYFNAFDGNMAYQLRDKEPRNLKDAFRIAINIENKMRISGKLGNKRDDPRLYGSRSNKREENKAATSKKQEENEMSQVLNAIKDLKMPQARNERALATKKPIYQNTFSKQN